MIEVVATGPLATVQDLGRSGYAELGVPRSGAFDRAALALGNRLVGNPAAAAGIEVTLGGLHVRLHQPATIALTGAGCPGRRTGAPRSPCGPAPRSASAHRRRACAATWPSGAGSTSRRCSARAAPTR